MHISIKMKSYCLKCRKDTENIYPKFQVLVMIKQWYQNMQYVVVKNQEEEAKGLLSNLGVRTPLSKRLILGDILF